MDTAKLLRLKFSDLALEIEGSRLVPAIKQLERELKRKGLKFKPYYWISREWFCADGHPGIAIPFYLFDPNLMKLHKQQGQKIEGKNHDDLMRYLRHECGHAIDNAYQLRGLKKRQEIFGPSKTRYPKSYRPQLYSKKYVTNIGDGYAQAHPEEDWAETFAIWLNPKSHWRKKYQNPVVKEKLIYIDELMKSLKHEEPKCRNTIRVEPLEKISQTLKTFYQHRASRNLFKNWKSTKASKKDIPLSTFLKANKSKILKRMNPSGNYKKYQCELLFKHAVLVSKQQKLTTYSNKQMLTKIEHMLSKYLKRDEYRIEM
ncbi:MAG: putative zinc-binding metallopeptidase [Bacteriovoracaceae bacterium]|nr:putative zinc-binding metallopeptidase [Bacteriovoracaceae bacterium]